jgi:hypothetical protein
MINWKGYGKKRAWSSRATSPEETLSEISDDTSQISTRHLQKVAAASTDSVNSIAKEIRLYTALDTNVCIFSFLSSRSFIEN